MAGLRLEPPDDPLQAPEAGRRPGCVGRRVGADRRRTGRQLDVAPRRSTQVGADLCREGERPGRSSCTFVTPSAQTRPTGRRTRIGLAATIARPGPPCCARATGVSATNRCPPRVTGDRRQPSVSKPRQFRDAAAKQKESSDSHACESDETPPPYARTAV